jgi:hypothetical protein
MPIRRLYSDWTTELAIDVSLAQQSGHIGGAPWQTHRGASLSLRAEVERPLRMRGSGGALLERHASLRATGRPRFSLRAANCIVHDIYRRRCRMVLSRRGGIHAGKGRPAEAPIDFVSLDAAKAEVLQSIRVAFDETPEEYQVNTLRLFYEICDEDGEVLDVVTFRDAIVH